MIANTYEDYADEIAELTGRINHLENILNDYEEILEEIAHLASQLQK